MRGGSLIVILVLGGVALFVLWKLRGASSQTTSAAPSANLVNGYTTPVVTGTGPTGGYDALQARVDVLSKTVAAGGTLAGAGVGTAVGSTAGSGAGSAVSSAEQGFGRTVGAPSLSDSQISRLEDNSAANGLTAGATAGANASGLVGGAVGGLFNVFPSFAKAAAPPLATATPVDPASGQKNVYGVPFLGGIWQASDALFGGHP